MIWINLAQIQNILREHWFGKTSVMVILINLKV